MNSFRNFHIKRFLWGQRSPLAGNQGQSSGWALAFCPLQRIQEPVSVGRSLFQMSAICVLGVMTGIILAVPGPLAAASPRLIPAAMTLKPVAPSQFLKVVDGQTIELTAGFARDKIGGKWITRLAYNGMIPGPTIVAKQGTKIKLKLTNHTGEPTSLHSHGLRVDDKNDGVIGIGQQPIPNNGSYVYDLTFPDAGLFWYHPHMSDEYGQEMGLQGNYLVMDADPSQMSKADRDEMIIVDDLLVEGGQLPEFKNGKLSYALMGRYGNINLINNNPHWQSKAGVGDVVRYWITNTANARPFKLKFSGARMKLLGGDSGLYIRDQLVDEVILAPSERALVDVFFPAASTVTIENFGPEKKQVLGRVSVTNRSRIKPADVAAKLIQFEALTERPKLAEMFKPLFAMASAQPDYTMKIDATIRGEHADHVMAGGGSRDGIEWEDSMPGMNAMMSDKEVSWRVIDPATGKENMDINWIFTKNKPVKIRLVNDGKHHPMQHPMHFHGQRFVILARNGKMETNVGWKDSVLVRSGETVDVVLDNQNPGRWMGHCHISEHLGTGMMFGFEVR
jgi:suppressor of ftsI